MGHKYTRLYDCRKWASMEVRYGRISMIMIVVDHASSVPAWLHMGIISWEKGERRLANLQDVRIFQFMLLPRTTSSPIHYFISLAIFHSLFNRPNEEKHTILSAF